MTTNRTQSVADNLKKWWNDHSSLTGGLFSPRAAPEKPDANVRTAARNKKAPTPGTATLNNNLAHSRSLFASRQASLTLPLGPFEATDAVLGEGGYAKVVLGRNRETGEKVAIKLLDTRQDQNAGRATSSEAAIVREVAALRRAGQHPNVCQLLGYYRLGDAGACHAMVMELCRGGELFRLVERYGAMDESKIRPIFNGVLAGVRHLHAQGIAHRDLKLENILLATSEQGEPLKAPQPKIVDLGLAHAHARGADGKGWAPRELTQFCGSRSYCAPEVMARLGYDGYQADVWSLGVCLFGLVSGFFPVDEASSRDWRFERIARLQHAHPHSSTTSMIFSFYQRPCPLSPSLIALLDGMLQVAPARRLTVESIVGSPWVNGASDLPPVADPMEPSSPTPPEMQVEVDISDFLQRTVSGFAANEGTIYRSIQPEEGSAEAAPPMICRQKAEESVGVMA